MVFKNSIITNTDRCGAGILKIFHTYSKFNKNYAISGEYVKSSVRVLERLPSRIRGKRFRPIRVGFILRSYYNLSVKNKWFCGSLSINFFKNSCIILRRRSMLKSPYVLGPASRPTRIKKHFYIFDYVL